MKKRPIMIVGALNTEIDLLVKDLEKVSEKNIGIYKIFEGEKNKYPVVIVKTEIGIANAAAATSMAIQKYNPVLIINEGTAGGITKEHHKKDIVISKKCININSYRSPYKEIGDGSDSRTWELLSFVDGGEDKLKVFYPNEHLVNIVLMLKDEYTEGNVFEGIIGSGDAWNREKDRLNYLYENHNVACEDMEAAAIFLAAEGFDIPMVAIKIMSDNELLGEEYEPLVAKYCQEFVKKILEELTKSEKNVDYFI